MLFCSTYSKAAEVLINYISIYDVLIKIN